MKLTAVASRIRNDIQHAGFARTAYEVLMEGINLVVDFRINKAMTLETVNTDLLESDEPLDWRFFSESELFALIDYPGSQLNERFLHAALDKGDECYGAFDGDDLACYGWYSNKPTNDNGLTVHFNPDYIYMYRGVTPHKYRGKRLHGIGMNRALREYLGRGHKGLVSTVDSHNFSSLKSVYRLGYKDIGYVIVLKLRSQVFAHSSRGCRKYDFYLSKPTEEPELAVQVG
jgi:hypothetical protein